jgi:signal transduction histidine kinase
MRRSFALRLAAAFAGVGIAAAALTALLVNLAIGGRFNTYLEEQRSAREEQLVAALHDSYVRMNGWNYIDLHALSPLVLMEGGTLRLEDPLGRTIYEPSATPSGNAMSKMHREMMGGGPLGAEERLPIRVDGRLVGTAVVRLPQPGLLPADESFRSSLNRILLFGGVGAGLAALALGLVLAGRASAPARELTRAARALAEGDRSRRVEFRSGDELGEMAQAFNQMADRIEEEDRLRKVFSADVAHELRTPLAILRSQVEGLQDGVIEPTPSALDSLHEETLRLSRLVADLETLASAEAAGFTLEHRPVALAELLQEAVREFAGPYESAGVALEADDLEPLVIEADPTRVRQIVSNLLSNALKFTPAGTVRISLSSEPGWAVISVSDSGPGIPTDELPHVFDRFFRGKAARARGSGIGLTVAHGLVRAHGGDILVQSELGTGTIFTVRLPLASPGVRASFTAPSNAALSVTAKGGNER